MAEDNILSATLELKDKYTATIKKSSQATKNFVKESGTSTSSLTGAWVSASNNIAKSGTAAFTTIGKSATDGTKKALSGFKKLEKGAKQAYTVFDGRSAFAKFVSNSKIAGKEAGKGLKDGVVKAAKTIPSILGGTLKGVGKGIGMGLGMGIFSSLTGAISSGIGAAKNTVVGGFFSHVNLEDQLVRNAGIIGITKDTATIKEMNKQVRELGASTEYTSQQAALAHKNYAMAGWKASDIMTITPRTLEFASATDITLDDASSIISNNLGALGWTAKDADKLTDIMGKTALSSNQSVLDVAEAFKRMAPISRGRDSAEDLGVITGLLADQNIKGGEVGNFYSSVSSRLNSDTEEVAKARQKLGVQTYRQTTYIDEKTGKKRVKLERKATLEIFEDIQKKLGKLNVKDQDAVTTALFGKNYQASGIALLNAIPTEKYKELTKAVYESNGAIAEQYKYWQDNSPMNRVKLLESAWDGFKERLGQAVKPVAIEYMEKLEDKLNGTTFSTENIENFFDAIKGYAEDAKPVLSAVWGFMEKIAKTIGEKEKKEKFKDRAKEIGQISKEYSYNKTGYMASIKQGREDGTFQKTFSLSGIREGDYEKINKKREEEALRYIHFLKEYKNNSPEHREEYERIQAAIPHMKLDDVESGVNWTKKITDSDKENVMEVILGRRTAPIEIPNATLEIFGVSEKNSNLFNNQVSDNFGKKYEKYQMNHLSLATPPSKSVLDNSQSEDSTIKQEVEENINVKVDVPPIKIDVEMTAEKIQAFAQDAFNTAISTFTSNLQNLKATQT